MPLIYVNIIAYFFSNGQRECKCDYKEFDSHSGAVTQYAMFKFRILNTTLVLVSDIASLFNLLFNLF